MRNVGRFLQLELRARRGALWTVAICSTLWVAGPSTAYAVALEIQPVLPRGAAPARVEIRLVEAVASPDAPAPRPQVHEVEVPGALYVDAEAGSVWHVSLVTAEYWAASAVIAVPAEPSSVRLPLWRTTRLRGRIQLGQGESSPDEIGLRFESPPDSRDGIQRATAICGIEETERFECVVPATRLDFRLRSPGFISHYFWNVALEPGKERDVGTVTLERGASVVGWIEMSDPRASFESSRVELSREIASLGLEGADARRRDGLALSSTVDERGFYEILGASEGLWAITATHPDFAPARYSPIQVFENAETELPSITLQPGVALHVNVQPVRSPSHRPWQVQLLRYGEAPRHLEEIAAGETGSDGSWRPTGLPPGEYFLRVRAGSESTWYSTDLVLGAGAGEVMHDIEMPIDTLAGRVFLGSEPVAADLYFGGYHGALRIPAESDGEGNFEAFLPEHETWTVDVYTRVKDARQRFQDVVPQPAGPDGRRWLELVVPDTLVQGRVVDTEGEAVMGARVRMSGPVGGTTYRSDADGLFEIRGLRPGRYWLRAGTLEPPRQSRILRFLLVEEENPEPFELVVRGLKSIEGQVVGPAGRPVVGAKVVALVEQTVARPVAARVPETVTDLEGVFALAVPEEAAGVQLTVFPPGFASSQLRVDTGSQEPVIFRAGPAGGTLRVHYGSDLSLERIAIFRAYLFPFYPYLINWAQLHGESNRAEGLLTIPMLEPGYYTACKNLEYETQMTGIRTGPGDRCVEGMLAPFGELDLLIPGAE